jgi:hypothetical protein
MNGTQNSSRGTWLRDAKLSVNCVGRDTMNTPLPFHNLAEPVEIPLDTGALPGVSALPPHPMGIVLFAHPSGGPRASGRNRAVVLALGRVSLGALVFDLLTETESRRRENRGRERVD